MIHLATCAHCPWEITVPTLARKQAAEAAHTELRHSTPAPVSDDVCDQLALTHPSEMQVVIDTIEACARVNHGQVDPNVVRELLPAGITPQVIPAAYNRMRRQGRLEVVGETPNLDTRGRNTNKKSTLYKLIEHVGSSW
jgi:hypothetical protein